MPDNTRQMTIPFEACEEKPYIFASYAHDDNERVFPLIKRLFETGYNVWYDEGIEIDTAYNRVIAAHVRECGVFVLFVSRRSMSSDYVVNKEFDFASRGKKRIIPLFLDDVKEKELPPEVAMFLKGERHISIEEVIAEVGKTGIKCFGKREAHSRERDVPQGWLLDEDEEKSGGRNLVGCTETPYAYIGIHPEERSVARAYIRALYCAGYNVRSFEYGSELERTRALSSKDCAAFVPVLTKKYVESGMLTNDADNADNADKPFIGLMVVQRDENGSEITVRLPDTLDMTHGGRQMINEKAPGDFITAIAEELKKRGCCKLDGSGKAVQRGVSMPEMLFLCDLTEDGEGIMITKYTGRDTDAVINKSYGGKQVSVIGEDAFENSNVTSVTIPEGVIRIGRGAFAGCTGLTSVTIPDSVTSIGDEAFDGYKKLTVYCPKGSAAWDYCKKNRIRHKTLNRYKPKK